MSGRTWPGSGARCRRVSARPTPAGTLPWAAFPPEGPGTWPPAWSGPGQRTRSPQAENVWSRGRAVQWPPFPRPRANRPGKHWGLGLAPGCRLLTGPDTGVKCPSNRPLRGNGSSPVEGNDTFNADIRQIDAFSGMRTLALLKGYNSKKCPSGDLNHQAGDSSQSGEISRGVFMCRENRGDVTCLGRSITPP